MADVRIYTKTGCPFCAAAKEDMDARGVRYEEIDVEGNAEALAEMERESGSRTVPTIIEGTKVTVGFGGG